MSTWMRFKAWMIRKLGGHVEDVNKPKELYFRHQVPTLIPLDRPFEMIDWERLSTLPNREPLFFEWIAHCINQVDKRLDELRITTDTDRDRLVGQVERKALVRILRVGNEAADHITDLLRRKEERDRKQKGMTNHGH